MGGPLFAILLHGLIILVLLVIGQLFYRRFPKVSYTIWGVTLALLVIVAYLSNTSTSRFGDRTLTQYTGTYTIDIAKSSYENIDLTEYKDLKLIVYENKTFRFSYKTPFFQYTTGYWQHMDDGDISWTEISVGAKNLRQANVGIDQWTFSGLDLANRRISNSIIFTRN